MIYFEKDTLSSFGLPLFDLATIANHGYLFKATSDYSDSIEYFIPTVTSEDERFTKFNYTPTLKAGQYKYEVFEYNLSNPIPTDETGLNRLALGTLKVLENETNDIYL